MRKYRNFNRLLSLLLLPLCMVKLLCACSTNPPNLDVSESTSEFFVETEPSSEISKWETESEIMIETEMEESEIEIEETEIETEEIEVEKEEAESEMVQDEEDTATVEYTFVEYTDPYYINSLAVFEDLANVYDCPSSSGTVIDTFGYKHMMFVIGKCNETGWYKIVYDDEICIESNYQHHPMTLYDYTSIRPAATPEDNFIIFSRTAQNIKTGYINPKCVTWIMGWEDEIYHVWNGIKIRDQYGMSQETLDFFKRLCYAEPFTVEERPGYLGMFIENPDDYSKACDLLESVAYERGYISKACYGSWKDYEANAYYVSCEYLSLEEQSIWIGYGLGSFGWTMNFDYIEQQYGYTSVLGSCLDYVSLDFIDESLVICDDETKGYTIMGDAALKICQIMEEYYEKNPEYENTIE